MEARCSADTQTVLSGFGVLGVTRKIWLSNYQIRSSWKDIIFSVYVWWFCGLSCFIFGYFASCYIGFLTITSQVVLLNIWYLVFICLFSPWRYLLKFNFDIELVARQNSYICKYNKPSWIVCIFGKTGVVCPIVEYKEMTLCCLLSKWECWESMTNRKIYNSISWVHI